MNTLSIVCRSYLIFTHCQRCDAIREVAELLVTEEPLPRSVLICRPCLKQEVKTSSNAKPKRQPSTPTRHRSPPRPKR